MKIVTLRLSNFQSFGPEPTAIDLSDLTYVLGPNGSGKTAVLEALSRLFSPILPQRTIRPADFHAPYSSAANTDDVPSTLWLEVDIALPESGDDGQHASVPPNFAHMRIATEDDVPQVRVRLTATLAPDGVVDEKIEYVLEFDELGNPCKTESMSRYDRGHIEVHYLPARRDPSDHIAYTTSSLIGRTLRAADWAAERTKLSNLSDEITKTLTMNAAVARIGIDLSAEWQGLHKGSFFADPAIAFGRGELEGVLRQITVAFSPSHDGAALPFERLSDGQKSLLYISLVLSWQVLARRVLAGKASSLDPDKLRPPVHTVIALEEPENSLAPQYLGRIIRQLRGACEEGDVQSVIATHAPALLRRVDPEAIRFLRLNSERQSTVHRVVLPDSSEEASKYVHEAVKAYPELYFSRLVVLGEGASEQVVIPRVLAAAGIAEDDASVSVVPLGGRHVNHFWRLLNELHIPHVTLLDLDSGRYQGGWGRVRNAANQMNRVKSTFKQEHIDKLPSWDADRDFPEFAEGKNAVFALEGKGVFFSAPVDLDLMMLSAFPDTYDVKPSVPDEQAIVAILGKKHVNHQRLENDVLALFDDYHAKFNLSSKPATHLTALASLDDEALNEGLPGTLRRLVAHVQARLTELPE
ncbi:ATP-dependent nuclease [Tsukamurella ocularis]|uniref:ATP-dependent nuclease n=1 Tax=Tsukamurella ocularis TaxID=1970234 RepID=UPI00216A65E1|nr:AAA family ATPase [Tsukamurella ocularis]MCS3779322.1 putative ATP-dependent endonuclease of OLD family [Tsukamurella ocularis]MCS3787058.1 putative ATP-dependent endonuclease of OLD family [Tsukamurella ocularis]MCS3852449.1 putative ATP-dependent endonuclease of OLD family [Tsukamurella ocularis]